MAIPNKKFSQNFLINIQAIEHIIELFMPKKNENVLEIGPGRGALTKLLLTKLDSLTVVEIDKNLCKNIANWQEKNITIHQMDILEYNFTNIKKPFRVIGNIPYHISKDILFHLLKFNTNIVDITIMLQKELAKRIIAKHNQKIYGRLSVVMQANYNIEEIYQIPAECFFPKPSVDSTLLYLKPKPFGYCYSKKSFELIVKLAFIHRRKTLKNCLKSVISQDETNIDLNKRAENLTILDFIELSLDYYKNKP